MEGVVQKGEILIRGNIYRLSGTGRLELSIHKPDAPPEVNGDYVGRADLIKIIGDNSETGKDKENAARNIKEPNELTVYQG